MGTTPCPASGVWIRAASVQLPLRWGRFFATYGNERGRQLRRPYSALPTVIPEMIRLLFTSVIRALVAFPVPAAEGSDSSWPICWHC